jgi:hypothetical protein
MEHMEQEVIVIESDNESDDVVCMDDEWQFSVYEEAPVPPVPIPFYCQHHGRFDCLLHAVSKMPGDFTLEDLHSAEFRAKFRPSVRVLIGGEWMRLDTFAGSEREKEEEDEELVAEEDKDLLFDY